MLDHCRIVPISITPKRIIIEPVGKTIIIWDLIISPFVFRKPVNEPQSALIAFYLP